MTVYVEYLKNLSSNFLPVGESFANVTKVEEIGTFLHITQTTTNGTKLTRLPIARITRVEQTTTK